MGMLSLALVASAIRSDRRPQSIYVTAYEIDPLLLPTLEQSLSRCGALCGSVDIDFTWEIVPEDFVVSASETIGDTTFTHAVMNPPYGKMPSGSAARLLLEREGLCAANWYAAFIGIALKRLEEGGVLLALTPRSYCNGEYFKKLRHQLVSDTAIRALHLYDNRRTTFADDDVLQEVLILKAERGGAQGPVWISTEAGLRRMADAAEVVSPSDPKRIIRITPEVNLAAAKIAHQTNSLRDIGHDVSTGRVLLHRLPETATEIGDGRTIPLIHAQHLVSGRVVWPLCGFGKPQSLRDSTEVAKLVLPAGIYVLVKRISGSEAPRRIEAAVYDGGVVAIDNHLNVIHCGGAGVSPLLAKGLTTYLNSGELDGYACSILGGTQVNASDLSHFRYPDRVTLEAIGRGFVSIADIL